MIPTPTPPIIGIDIGGTKLAAGVWKGGAELHAWESRETRIAEGPAAVLERTADLARDVARAAGVRLGGVAAIGVAAPGPLDPWAGTINGPPNLPGWDDVPLTATLGAALGRPVHLDNDANAAALSEHRFGAGRGVDDLVYVTISTGLGAGIIAGGRLIHGGNGNAGEVGHTTVRYDGRLCPCGRKGCLEAYASGTGIAARAREALDSEDAGSSTLAAVDRASLTARDVVAAVRSGDAVATRVWAETIELLAQGIANVVNAFNPRLVIVGGGVAEAGDLLLAPLRCRVLELALPRLAAILDVVAAGVGASTTTTLGAVAVALDRLASPERAEVSRFDAVP